MKATVAVVIHCGRKKCGRRLGRVLVYDTGATLGVDNLPMAGEDRSRRAVLLEDRTPKDLSGTFRLIGCPDHGRARLADGGWAGGEFVVPASVLAAALRRFRAHPARPAKLYWTPAEDQFERLETLTAQDQVRETLTRYPHYWKTESAGP